MSRLPFYGWKLASRTLGLGLLGACLAFGRLASAGCVSLAPSVEPAEFESHQSEPGNLDLTFARAAGLAPAADTRAFDNPAVDPLDVLSRFCGPETAPQRTPMFEVAPPNPFLLSTMGKPQEPVKSIPNLPALWSGMTGLGGLGALACFRRARRAIG